MKAEVISTRYRRYPQPQANMQQLEPHHHLAHVAPAGRASVNDALPLRGDHLTRTSLESRSVVAMTKPLGGMSGAGRLIPLLLVGASNKTKRSPNLCHYPLNVLRVAQPALGSVQRKSSPPWGAEVKGSHRNSYGMLAKGQGYGEAGGREREREEACCPR